MGAVSPSRGNAALKAKRQQTIVSLVDQERLSTQEDIRARLSSMGLDATQSTISRDIEELGLARVHDHDGVRYVVPGGANGGGDGNGHMPLPILTRLLQEFALSFTRADHAVVIRTPPGAAAALAEGLDRAGLPDVAGTIAGDNTILVIGRERVTSRRLEDELTRIMEAS